MREDNARTFDERRNAYIDYYHLIAERLEIAEKYLRDREPDCPKFDNHKEVDAAFTLIRIYGSIKVWELALVARSGPAGLRNYVAKGDIERALEFHPKAKLVVEELLKGIREDLGVSESAPA